MNARTPLPGLSQALTLPLPHGLFALVDAEDAEDLSRFKWFVNGRGYVVRNVPASENDGQRSSEYMHRRIARSALRARIEIDHIDGDKLNNRRSNLRAATHAQNLQNKRKTKQNKSGFKGVCFDAREGKWRATINAFNTNRSLGYFDSADEAHEAYKIAAAELHGNFANFG